MDRKARNSSSLPTKTIKLEVLLANSAPTGTPHSVTSEQAPTVTIEEPVVAPGADEASDSLPSRGQASSSAVPKAGLDRYEPRCWAGVQTMVNLTLPDRYVPSRPRTNTYSQYHSVRWISVFPHSTRSLFLWTNNQRSCRHTHRRCNLCECTF